MTFLTEMDSDTGLVDSKSSEKGKDIQSQYAVGDPFPHIVIDDFLPRQWIDRCIAEIGLSRNENQRVYDRAQERLKREFKPDDLSPAVRQLFYSFNSRPFLKIVENISGIKGLIPDPYFMGGGFHEISNGGHLSVHADFNHHVPLNLERRINLLIYLNDDWRDEFGGQLELWTNDMTKCVKSIVPIANRCVIFNTTSFSNHGNPNPVNHPEGISRKSIALYYYTATWDATRQAHTTRYRPRADTVDRTDWLLRRKELYEDFVPPVIRRNIARVNRIVTGNSRLFRKNNVN
jgi:Rps23 Pro-64 3,4-dihydroxylase Tpa1-like proline 4-hydroxylase